VRDPNLVLLLATLLKFSKNENQQFNLIEVLGFSKLNDPALQKVIFNILEPFLNSNIPEIRGRAIIAVTRLNPAYGAATGLHFLSNPEYFKSKYLRLKYSYLRNRILNALKIFMADPKVELKFKQEAMIILFIIMGNFPNKINIHKNFTDYFLETLESKEFRPIIESLSEDQKKEIDSLRKRFKSYSESLH